MNFGSMEGYGRYIALALFIAFVVFAGYMNYKEDKEEFAIVVSALVLGLLFLSLMVFICSIW